MGQVELVEGAVSLQGLATGLCGVVAQGAGAVGAHARGSLLAIGQADAVSVGIVPMFGGVDSCVRGFLNV